MGIIKTSNPKIKLKEIIFNSKLNNKQKELWYDFIHLTMKQNSISILKTLNDNIESLIFLTKNLENKLKVLKTDNKKLWGEVLKEEKISLESN